MAKKIYIFEVEGRGYFPYDMLRYDRCWPHTQEDTPKLDSFMGTEQRKRSITLMSETKPPTVKRWESFGWRVIAQSERKVA
jgi:hypothetical protein